MMSLTLFVYHTVFNETAERDLMQIQPSACCAKASAADYCRMNVYELISVALFLLRLRAPLDFYYRVLPGTASYQFQAVRTLPYVLHERNIPP